MIDWIHRVERDARFVATMVRVFARLRGIRLDGNFTVADAIERFARETPGHPAILFQDRVVSYRELDLRANRYANWAQAHGLGRGEVVALLMENRPEFVFAWLGLAKIGAVAALINTNLSEEPLAHSLRVARARHVILGAEVAAAWATAGRYLEDPPTAWVTGGATAGSEDLDRALEAAPDAPVGPESREGLRARDNVFYIYTSGTTGLPKAANFSHFRFLATAFAGGAMAGLTASDRMYVALPLYHTAGGVMAAGAALVSGATVVLARKFSASRFWSDCATHGATVFQYIGELCRYLLNTPEHPDEKRHSVRLVIGNGLRPEIWESFQKRFGIPRILEFYGATEGNVVLVNLDNKVGSIGRIPPYLRGLLGIYLVKFDFEREEPVRGADGLCVECAPGEVGEAVGWIPSDSNDPRGRFEGYSDESATERKRLRDVFKKGDVYFRSGDLMRMDGDGYCYFVDRIGDTFRWKGENVATSEVAEALARFPGVQEANVYGVRIPGADGRAGMAALVAHGDLDLAALHDHATRRLAAYARPLFLRLRAELEVTATLKHRKVDLVNDGFDPSKVTDPLYFADPEARRFVRLDRAVYERIVGGGYRF